MSQTAAPVQLAHARNSGSAFMRNPLVRLGKSPYWRDIAWLASGSAVAQLIAFAAMPALTRLYAPHDFAQQTLFVQLAGFAAVLLTWRYEFFVQLPKEPEAALRLLHLVLTLGVGGTVVGTLLVWPFRDSLAGLLGAPEIAPWLLIIPFTALLMCTSVALQNLVQRLGMYRHSTASEVLNKTAFVGCALAGFWILPAPAGLILATGLGATAKILLLLGSGPLRSESAGGVAHSLRLMLPRSPPGMRAMAETYFKMSGSMVISHLLMSCTAIIPSIFMARQFGTDSLGQFSLALASIYIPTSLIGSSIGQVYYQRAAQQWAAGQSFVDLWRSTSKRLITLGLPVYIAVMLTSPWLYPYLFGDSWGEAGRYASILAVGAFFSFISTPLDRGCLIVGAWLYIPMWHVARTATTALAVGVAWWGGWQIESFVVLLVAQMSLMFLIDYRAEFLFAKRRALPNLP